MYNRSRSNTLPTAKKRYTPARSNHCYIPSNRENFGHGSARCTKVYGHAPWFVLKQYYKRRTHTVNLNYLCLRNNDYVILLIVVVVVVTAKWYRINSPDKWAHLRHRVSSSLSIFYTSRYNVKLFDMILHTSVITMISFIVTIDDDCSDGVSIIEERMVVYNHYTRHAIDIWFTRAYSVSKKDRSISHL